jgi:hypothetical protein
MSAQTSTIYQESDLNEQYRTLLDAARRGDVRIRDRDGVGVVLTLEGRLHALQTIARTSANLLTLELARERSRDELALTDYGEWTWLRHLDAADLTAFIEEVRRTLLIAAREYDSGELDEALYAWQITAEAAADPKRSAVLLGDWSDDDFVEVERPTASAATGE